MSLSQMGRGLADIHGLCRGRVNDLSILVKALFHGGFDILHQFHLPAKVLAVTRGLQSDIASLNQPQTDPLAGPLTGKFIAEGHTGPHKALGLVYRGQEFHGQLQGLEPGLGPLQLDLIMTGSSVLLHQLPFRKGLSRRIVLVHPQYL